MSDDRADRLRKRREEQKEKISENIESDSGDSSSDPSKTSKTSETSETGNVKEELKGVYMYLPEELADDLAYQYKILDAEFGKEFGENLEKNREFYRLVVRKGLDSLDSSDIQDIREELE